MSGGPYGGLSGGGGIGGGGFGVMSGGPAAGATVTQYAIGPRGTEKITSRDAQTGNTIKVLYAMYDAHGNMMSTARRSGSQLLIENHRGYDAWGAIRWGDGSTGGSGHGVGGGGDPFDASATDGSQRYVANLGHMADDESGLIYMRARYYEPATGRFISEDPALDGKNWFAYAANNPINEIDQTGLASDPVRAIGRGTQLAFITQALLGALLTAFSVRSVTGLIILNAGAFFLGVFARELFHQKDNELYIGSFVILGFIATTMITTVSVLSQSARLAESNSFAREIVGGYVAYAAILLFMMAIIDFGDWVSRG